jgi:Domain of unknown function (DUF4375)
VRVIVFALVACGSSGSTQAPPPKKDVVARDATAPTIDAPAYVERPNVRHPSPLACAESIPVLQRPKLDDTASAEGVEKLSASDVLKIGDDGNLYGEVERRIYKNGTDGLTGPERDIYVIAELEAEIYNGGLVQYFENSSGRNALEALAALGRVGLAGPKAAFACALTAFPNSKPNRNREARAKELEKWGEAAEGEMFETIGDAIIFSPGYWTITSHYIRAHASAFTHL